MANSAKRGTTVGRLAAWVLPCVLAAGLLQGCVNTRTNSVTGEPVAETRPELVTDSDESPQRRRARLRLELASSYFEADKTNIALDEIKQSLAADPDFGDAYNLRGLIYMRLGDNDLAEQSFRRAVQLNPRDGNAMHNQAWLLCQQKRYDEADKVFAQTIALPAYTNSARTLMAQGICQVRAGRPADAERTLVHAYELDPGNPITGFTLATLLRQRGDLDRARFYIRRVNNGEYATAESLWLGMRIERRLNDNVAVSQLGEQLRKRFPGSREAAAYDSGAFDE